MCSRCGQCGLGAGKIDTLEALFLLFVEVSYFCLQEEADSVEVASKVPIEDRTEEASVHYWPPSIPAVPMVWGMSVAELENEVRDN